MNTLLATVFATVLLAIACVVAPAHAGDLRGDSGLVFDCSAIHLPSQQNVAHLLGTHNFSQTYTARALLLQDVRRECLRGVRQVLVKTGDKPDSMTASVLAKAH